MPDGPEQAFTPAEALATLPEPELDPDDDTPGDALHRVELRHAILTIAELDHVSESTLVRAVVTRVRGDVPVIED